LKLGLLYTDEFGERVLGNLVNYSTFCKACDLACEHCRTMYGSFASDIYWVHQLPGDLPVLIEDPAAYLPSPDELPKLDVLLIVGIHPDLLASVPFIVKGKASAVIVPLESKDWCPPGLRRQVAERLAELGIESAFPKPFCSLTPLGLKVIDEFIAHYRVGRPIVEAVVKEGIVKEARVIRSAPCGATWYITRQILNKHVDEVEEAVARAHHSYPCTGSMAVDPEVGDTILHKGGYLAREAVKDALIKQGVDVKLSIGIPAFKVEARFEGMDSYALLEVVPRFEDQLGLVERVGWVLKGELMNPALYELESYVDDQAVKEVRLLKEGSKIYVKPKLKPPSH